MFRNNEYQSSSAVNVGVTWVYDTIPHLVFYCNRDTEKGEELISSYGSDYWDVMCRQALRGHSAYFAFIRPYVASLEKLLQARGVPLPDAPDYTLFSDPLFRAEKPGGDYSPPPEEEQQEGGEGDGKEKKKTNPHPPRWTMS